MFAAVFKEVSGLLNKRFVLNALFPATLLGIGLAVVWEATGEGLGEGVDRLTALDGTTKGVVAILAVAAVLVTGMLLASQSSNLLTWMEGIGGPFRWSFFADPGKSWWEGRLPGANTSHPLFGVPRDGDVAPTALGTLGFANAEYVTRNYGAELAVVWPRLAPFLPDGFASQVDDAEATIEQLVSFSTTTILFGMVAGSVAAYHRAPVIVCMLLPLAAFSLGFILYRAVMPAAERWSQLVRTGFDLYRFNLLDALQMPRPRTSAEERVVWTRVSAVLLGQDPDRSLGFASKKA